MRKQFECVAARCLLAVGFFCVQAANAQTTINVPADQPTIQAGIDAAVNGDTVMVAPGTYSENLNFNGKFITVASSGGPRVTIVDGGGLGPVVTFNTNEGANSVLNGFTLQNGVPSTIFPASGTTGAGIWIYYASPTITNNLIVSNHAICGIGMEVQGGSAIIRGNTISDNTQAGGTGGCGGGGIEVTGDSSHPPATPQIIGNIITKNNLGGGGNGGGIAVEYFASPIIQNNYIVGNTVYNSGGGVYLQSYGAPVVVQNFIMDNVLGAGGSGAGIYVEGTSSSAAVIANNTILENSAADASSGIFADVLSPIAISNNIVEAASGENAIVCSIFSATTPIFSHNDVLSPGTGGQAWLNCGSVDQGNISVDPQFVNPASLDFHLQPGSPAVDAGDNSAPNLPLQDYDDNTRVVDGNGDCVDTVDIGIYELQTPPQAGFSPASLSFPNQLVNTTSSTQTLTLSNTGTGCLKIQGLAVTGDFAQTSTCGTSLHAGQSCVINVTFTPAATGTRTGTLSLSSNSTAAPLPVSLTGTGVNPAISVSPASITFGDQVLNTTAAYQTITVTNPGTTALHVSALSVSGDTDLYTITNTCVGGTGIAPGGNCTIQVGFTPRTLGLASALLSISSDAPTSPTSVTLSGNGLDAASTASPASLSFASQVVNTSSASQTVTLTNPNGAPLQISSITVSGDFAETNNCPASMAANSSCVIQVTFQPAATGVRTGSISISSNSVPSVTAISLSGTGVQPAISVSPASIAFADQVLNTTAPNQTITVTNPGTGTLHVSSIIISGDTDLYIATNNCIGATGTAPGGSCSIQVGFTPRSLGPAAATLIITSDAPTTPSNISLSGNGVNSAPALSPTSLSFGNIFVGKTSGGKAVKLTSNGPSALAISGISASGGFIQTNNCPASLSPGSSCTINVSFKPLGAGATAGTLTILDNGLGSPQSVALSGNGLDFSISASPSSATVTAGQKAGYTITVGALGGSYTTNVALSCSGLPTGVKCSFSPSGVSPGSSSASSALTVSTTSGGSGTPPGSYTITINGVANGTTHSTTVVLDVN